MDSCDSMKCPINNADINQDNDNICPTPPIILPWLSFEPVSEKMAIYPVEASGKNRYKIKVETQKTALVYIKIESSINKVKHCDNNIRPIMIMLK